MKSAGEILNLSIEFLKKKKVDGARRIAEDLLAHALQLKRMELYMQFDRPVTEEELNRAREFFRRVSTNEPVQYIIGEMDFYGAKLQLDRRALIPRPETEILVDMISKENPKGEVWDLCTGTGCIGIALKKKHPDLHVVCTDISKEALELAKKNGHINQVEIEFIQGDLFEPLKGRKADVVISNPPYISLSEYKTLDPSVHDFEPKLALVGGERGSEFYERFQKEIYQFLKPKGSFFFEIGQAQEAIIQKLFPNGKVFNDWAGHPRFFLEKL